MRWQRWMGGQLRRKKMLHSKKALKAPRFEGKAKNIIVCVGDGMGVSTHTLSRIYKGQKKGRSREEESLVWEDWDYSGLIKTYGHPNAGLCRYSYSAVQRDEDTVGHALCNGKVGYPPGIFASSPITHHSTCITHLCCCNCCGVLCCMATSRAPDKCTQ